jgi:small-conductance mechanosensitive channel
MFFRKFFLFLFLSMFLISRIEANENLKTDSTNQVSVGQKVNDSHIEKRLEEILNATGWYKNPSVKSEEGIVTLLGVADNEERLKWAEKLANNTEGVVVVINKLVAYEEKVVDLSPALVELKSLWSDIVKYSPLFGIGIILLILTYFLCKLTIYITNYLLKRRVKSGLLREVLARLFAVPVFILGAYIMLKISGLTHLAMTLIGGTSLIGIVIGFAFRDIAENFLSSILLSLQRPFARGDLIEVSGHQGFVQSVNTRSTIMMTLDGNHVQIPNATIYKETITNYTSNPLGRTSFLVGIGYADSVTRAQDIALKILKNHPAVVEDPEPLILAEELASATVNIKIYFWINIHKYSLIKVRSAIIRLTKHAFEEAGIEMPDDAREVVFPKGIPLGESSDFHKEENEKNKSPQSLEDEQDVHLAEGDLLSEDQEIKEQAKKARSPEGGTDLLSD